MTDDRPIAIAGAGGAIGRALVLQLKKWGIGPIRLGVRQPEKYTAEENAYEFLDVLDRYSVSDFIDGAQLLINCAGPSSELGYLCLEAGLQSEINVIDVNGDEALYKQLSKETITRSCALIGCGMMPGLSAALPLWAAAQINSVGYVRSLIGGRDSLTLAGVQDLLDGLRNRVGTVPTSPSINNFESDQVSRLFGENAFSIAYADPETSYVQSKLGADHVDSQAVYLDQSTWSLLAAGVTDSQPSQSTAHNIVRASLASVAGQTCFQQFVVDLFERKLNKEDATEKGLFHRVLLRASGASELSAATLAVATSNVLDGNVENGVHRGSDTLANDESISRLKTTDAVHSINVQRLSINRELPVVKGVL